MRFVPAAPVIIVAAVIVWGVYLFNRLVRHRNLVREAWSGIDVQLKRRHDLVPALVEVVRGHARFERATLEEITNLRGAMRPVQATRDLQDRENALSTQLRGVLAIAEAYPELRANQSFLSLQSQLVEVENQLQLARRYYNGAVRDYDIAVESFPSNLLAGVFGFRREEFFQVASATERQTPAVAI